MKHVRDMSRDELMQLVEHQQAELVKARTVNVQLKARVAVAIKLLREQGIEDPCTT